ncbi:hypothetical protein [Oceanobacillus piezotolerans]|uniref:hypothetical protein n=1 Tax=Oceanobacillus piezotolerans TaxID=2448030 RepID=UPI0013141653|nr:hypothetical protein [Oceanobacillus piezotolerans]
MFTRTLNMDQGVNNEGLTGDRAIPKWFNEESAEYLSGGADRVWGGMKNLI